MPRVKLSEFRAKTIVNNHLKTPYSGFPFTIDHDPISKIEDSVKTDKKYVVKVDQGIKKRFKQGLIKLDLEKANDIIDAVSELSKKGYSHFLIEEMIAHEDSEEHYLALERAGEGTVLYYSSKGGVDVEAYEHEVKKHLITDPKDIEEVASKIELSPDFLTKIIEVFEINYFSFLEINPLVISFKTPFMLDIASEVDSAAEFFVDNWSSHDIRSAKLDKTEEEKNIAKVAEKSSSSLTLTVLNPNGSIFMLLSGGGVSVMLADEVQSLGYGGELANYGEYSGNPTEEETFLYAKNLLSLLLKSQAKKKVLIIGGGVANFTDIRTTFLGVIRAISDVVPDLQEQGVKVFVRRGGPHQKEGLEIMRKFLDENKLLGAVHGPEFVVSDIVGEAIISLSS
ncbi:MAG TPA: ATP citrate lyase citrate-binding domain-containing protein [Patescibacteria group bacterium]|nr:ATP citrate lyase citrate-binding domain-containing protein [Patescibacteria group bacterium]